MTLGEFLRHERERRGITIEQVASATKVGVRTLHSLEADHYNELPAKPFIRGFVTAYSRFIGLDVKEVLARFDDYMSAKSIERPSRDSGHSGYAFEKKDGEQQSRTILMMAVAGFILFGGLAMIFLKPSLRHHHSSHIEKLRAAHGDPTKDGTTVTLSSVPLTVVSLVNSLPLPLPSLTAPSPVFLIENKVLTEGMNQNDPLDSGLDLKANQIRHKVTLKVLADIWVRYQVDDRPVRKFIMRKDKLLVLRAQNGVRLQVSNINSSKIIYNGKNYDKRTHIKEIVSIKGNSTLFFPFEIAQGVQKPFGDAPPLQATADPEIETLSEELSPSPSPSQ